MAHFSVKYPVLGSDKRVYAEGRVGSEESIPPCQCTHLSRCCTPKRGKISAISTMKWDVKCCGQLTHSVSRKEHEEKSRVKEIGTDGETPVSLSRGGKRRAGRSVREVRRGKALSLP